MIENNGEENQPKDSRVAKQRTSKALLAVIIIFLGITFLFNNFGILPWSAWDLIWRFWPIVLVFVGLQISFGKSWLADFVITVLGLAVITFILALAFASVNPEFNSLLGRELRFWNPHIVDQLTPRQQNFFFQDNGGWEI